MEFLGYVISKKGVHLRETDVRLVCLWKEPCSIKELRNFLGFANYLRSYMRKFSGKVSELHDLIKGNLKKILWGTTSRRQFRNLLQNLQNQGGFSLSFG
jgi:hypothetical protein